MGGAGGSWGSAPRDGCFSPNQGAGAAAQPPPPRLLPLPGDPELGSDPGARGEEGKEEVRPWTRGGQGAESIASPELAAGYHLQPLKEAPPEKMPSVASCRCSQEPKRHLADWGGSGAYVFIGLTLPCPLRKGWLQRLERRERGAAANSQIFSTDPNTFHTPHPLPFVDNFLLDPLFSLPRPLSPSLGQKVLGGGGRNRQTSNDFLLAKSGRSVCRH